MTSLVSLGIQAKAKPISHVMYYKEIGENQRETQRFHVFLCHLLSHYSHVAGKGEGDGRSCTSRRLEVVFVPFMQQLGLLMLSHAVNNNLKINYLLYLCVLSFGRPLAFSGTAASTSQLTHSIATIFFFERLTASAVIIHIFFFFWIKGEIELQITTSLF